MKILVVDDNLEELSHLCNLLERNEFRTIPASTAKRALGIAFHNRPDLVLYDITMLEIDGFSFCEFLKLNPETLSIPVAFMANGDYQADDGKLYMSGSLDVIKKPIKENEFILKMNAYHKFIKTSKKRKPKENLKYSI